LTAVFITLGVLVGGGVAVLIVIATERVVYQRRKQSPGRHRAPDRKDTAA